ncbi:hypothetical protein ACQP3D_29000, partial [Escherichia coli]
RRPASSKTIRKKERKRNKKTQDDGRSWCGTSSPTEGQGPPGQQWMSLLSVWHCVLVAVLVAVTEYLTEVR